MAFAVYYGRQGLRVNCVCAGPLQAAFRPPEGADARLLQRILPFDGFRPPGMCA